RCRSPPRARAPCAKRAAPSKVRHSSYVLFSCGLFPTEWRRFALSFPRSQVENNKISKNKCEYMNLRPSCSLPFWYETCSISASGRTGRENGTPNLDEWGALARLPPLSPAPPGVRRNLTRFGDRLMAGLQILVLAI